MLNTKSGHMSVLKFLNWENVILVWPFTECRTPFLNILNNYLSGKWAPKQWPSICIGSISINPMLQTRYLQIIYISLFSLKKESRRKCILFITNNNRPGIWKLFTSLKWGKGKYGLLSFAWQKDNTEITEKLLSNSLL